MEQPCKYTKCTPNEKIIYVLVGMYSSVQGFQEKQSIFNIFLKVGFFNYAMIILTSILTSTTAVVTLLSGSKQMVVEFLSVSVA